jgi:Protein of unknown function (DUF2778)
MASATAAMYGVGSFDGRVVPAGAGRRIARFAATNLMMAAAAVTTVAVLGVTVTLGAAWIVNRSVASNPRIYSAAPIGPASLALVTPERGRARVTETAFAEKWAQTASLMSLSPRPIAVPENVASLEPAKPAPVVKPVELADVTPLPRPLPAELHRVPVEDPAPKPAARIATVAPPAIKPVPVAPPPPVLAEADRRTALYDIAGHTVYLPNGQKLEAHSGLYDKMDDPRFIKVRMRGPTPPNVYDLTLREELFHGVRAIRLNPVDEGRMYGRDGMLAHTYMLGPNGQSNGCVSFKDYKKFLTAFLDGEVNRLVVVPELGKTPWRTAVAEHGHLRRYAANN